MTSNIDDRLRRAAAAEPGPLHAGLAAIVLVVAGVGTILGLGEQPDGTPRPAHPVVGAVLVGIAMLLLAIRRWWRRR